MRDVKPTEPTPHALSVGSNSRRHTKPNAQVMGPTGEQPWGVAG